MQSDSLKELSLLHEAVNQTSTDTEKQVKSVDLNLPLTIIAFLVNIGVVYYFKNLMIYWITTSYFFISIWSVFSAFKSLIPALRASGMEPLNEGYGKFGPKAMNYGYTWIFEVTVPLTKAIGLIFLITFVGLLLILMEKIQTPNSINVIYPLLVCTYYVLAMLFQGVATNFSRQGGFSKNYNFMTQIIKKKSIRIAIKVVTILFALIVVGIPVLALIFTFPLILPFSTDSYYLILVLFLQILLFFISGSFFSSLLVKKELNNSITNLSIISEEISNLKLNNDITEEKVEKLKEQYTSSKIYELKIEDFWVVHYYSLNMRKVYLSKLIESKDDTST